jgi:hypothetical protein
VFAIGAAEEMAVCAAAEGVSVPGLTHLAGTGHNLMAEMSVGELPAFAVQATFAATASSPARKHSAAP